ncbi:MAG TPA: HAMP domain-containing sensor histidine kinase [Aeromicrobium sp.]|nr:HAMP domain-containing sensor histidine kinase [Aeromicrobium sp.]
MSDAPVDPRWANILSLSVHEFRTPMTVVAGYIRMLLKERAGPVSEQQRKLLEEAEKGCARLTALLTEVSELSNLEAGTAPFNRQLVDLQKVLRDSVDQLAPLPDRDVAVELDAESSVPIHADPVRLGQAFASVMKALRREIITESPLIVRLRPGTQGGDVLIGDNETIAAFDADDARTQEAFDEWRGGSGLILPVARRIFEAHGGRIHGAPGARKTGARIQFTG